MSDNNVDKIVTLANQKESFDYSNQYRHPVFDQVMKESFDITDDETRRVLLSVNEADQNQVVTALTSKLYDNIVEKVDDVDYGNIPATKGDITKLPNYEDLTNCIDIMKQLLIEFKQDTAPMETLEHAVSNIVGRKEMFERAYKFNIELPVVMYSTMVLAIISGTSLMISSCVEFIKTPNEEMFAVSIDKVGAAKSKQHMLFNNLEKFNRSCANGDFDKAMDGLIKTKTKNLVGGTAAIGIIGGIALMGILFNLLPILRELIFFFYYTRTRVSDYFDIQADLLQMNAYNIEHNTAKDDTARMTVAKKQFKIVDLFRKIADKLSISAKESEVKATKEILDTNKKYKTSDVLDSMPDSASSSLF